MREGRAERGEGSRTGLCVPSLLYTCMKVVLCDYVLSLLKNWEKVRWQGDGKQKAFLESSKMVV